MSRILTPSEINFLIESKDGSHIEPDDGVLNDLSQKFIETNQIPKIQVSEKNGAWFALNNTSLHVIKQLEKQGRCSQVQVEIVPLSKVPISLQKGMLTTAGSSKMEKETVFTDCCPQAGDQPEIAKEARVERRGFRKLQIEENFGIESNECGNSLVKNGSANYSYDDGESSGNNSSCEASDYDQDYDDSEGDESLVCNVCDRTFQNGRQLGRHQLHRSHFCCSVCDALFPTLMVLQIHKKTLEHWTDDEVAENDDESNDDEFDDQASTTLAGSSCLQPCEEVERLL